jgi:hypothetical protein
MAWGAWWVWGVALAAYGAFRWWYDGRRAPLAPHEVEAFMAALDRLPASGHTDRALLRAFLEADDGREFVMSNLVRVHPGEVPHPVSGAPTTGLALFGDYGRQFVRLLLRHGGHPVMAMRKVGGYLDAWNTPPDPGWHIVGAMRYRSRRDLVALALDPALREVHPLKLAGTAATFSFPTQPILSLALPPRASVALVLALAAALAHLASLLAAVASVA